MKLTKLRTNRGFAFLTVMFVMLAFTTLGAGAVSMVTGGTEMMEDEYHSQQAFDLANAGLAYEAEQLENDSDWSDNAGYTKTMAPGEFTISYISQSVNVCLVKSVGTVEGVSRAVQQRFNRGSIPKAFESALYTEGDINVGGAATGSVDGDVSAGGTVITDEGVGFDGDVEENNPDADAPSVDWAYWNAIADHHISGNKNFTSGTYSGIYYIDGNLTMGSDVTINGTLIVTGKVTINGASNVTITATPPNPAIVSNGTMTLNGNTDLVVSGYLFTEDTAKITGNQDMDLTGGIVSIGTIEISGSSISDITYDANYAPSGDGFIGGEGGGGGGETLQAWEETI